MKTKLKYLLPSLIVIGLTACTDNRKADNPPTPFFPLAQSLEANTKEGYKINPVTGDSILPILNSLGDTLKTGVKIPVKGKHIHPDSVSKPKIIKAGKGNVVNAHTNRHKIPENLTTIKVNKDSLTKVLLTEITKSDTAHYILNSDGKKVKTGTKIPVKGKKVKSIHPKSTSALPLRIKENATCDIQYLDVDQGMSSSSLRCILEDKSGNLWFATQGSGVSKYDGESFIHFTETEGLSSNYINSIFEDKSGNIWFGTDAGVSKYDGESFIHFTEKEGLSNYTVISILEDKNGNFWFGTYESGAIKYDGESFIYFTEKEGLSNNSVVSILEDKSGNLWFGTFGGGVNKYDGKSFTHFTEKDGLSNNKVWSIKEDKSGNLWFATSAGLSKYDGESFIHFTEKEGLSNNLVLSILEDKSGNLWFGTWTGGVNKYDGKSFTHFTEKEGLSNNNVFSIIEDKSGYLWFGTDGGGVNNYDGESFIYLTEKEGLSNKIVNSILEDKSGNLWFGTWGGGVSKYDGESFIHFTEKDGLSNDTVLSILEDKSGNIWFGTKGGVNKYDGESFIHFTKKEGLSGNSVNFILEDKNGNLWFATSSGVSKYDGKNFIHFTEKEGLSNNYTHTILEDKSGNLWFANAGCGVSKYDGESFIHFTEKEGLSNNYINSILEDKSGNLWFGSWGGGLIKYDGESFTHFTEKEGISKNQVYSIIEDKSGNIFLSGTKGISKLEISSEKNKDEKTQEKNVKNKLLKSNYSIQILTKQFSLKDLYYNAKSALIDSKNRGWWGGRQRLEMLDLNKFKTSQKIPRPVLKQVEINENFIDYRNLSDSLKNKIVFNGVQRFENYPLNLELPFDKNHLTFHFSAIDWAAQHKIHYSYRMLGLDNNWSAPTKEAKAVHRNLSYGTYTFQIRAIGDIGEWSEPFEYTFTIHPPWWHTTWFRSIMVGGLLLILFVLFRWRTAALIKRQKELEIEVELATKEIREQRDEILDSMTYAKRIQNAILPPSRIVKEYLQESFILYKPKDIVAGDFYWMEQKDEKTLFAAADCTGHGVPGAMVSVICNGALNRSVREFGLTDPGEILGKAREFVIQEFEKSDEEVNDGMDISLCALNVKTNELLWAGANNPIWIIRNDELLETKPNKQPIGKMENQKPFTTHTIALEKGDAIYIFTDGYQDQFGGEKGKKFKPANFKNLLLSIQEEPMEKQREIIDVAFEEWKGDLEQVDDVCLIGVKIE